MSHFRGILTLHQETRHVVTPLLTSPDLCVNRPLQHSPQPFVLLLTPYWYRTTLHLLRLIEKQKAKHAETEKILQSQVESVQDQLRAAHAEADRKQTVVDNLTEVSDVNMF